MTKLTGTKGFNYKRLAQVSEQLSLEQVMDSLDVWGYPRNLEETLRESLIEAGYLSHEDFDYNEDFYNSYSDAAARFVDEVEDRMQVYLKLVLSLKYK